MPVVTRCQHHGCTLEPRWQAQLYIPVCSTPLDGKTSPCVEFVQKLLPFYFYLWHGKEAHELAAHPLLKVIADDVKRDKPSFVKHPQWITCRFYRVLRAVEEVPQITG